MDGAAAIDTLDELVAAIGQMDRYRATVARAAHRIARLGEWRADGSLSMARWLETHAHMLHADASGLLREGRFLDRYQPIGDAAASGVLSGGQVRLARAAVSSATATIMDELAADVVDILDGLSIQRSEFVMAEWKQRADSLADPKPPKLHDVELTLEELEDGTTVGRFVLDAAASANLRQALDTAAASNGPDDTRSTAQRNAEALVDIVGFFNANHDRPGTPRHRPHVELHI